MAVGFCPYRSYRGVTTEDDCPLRMRATDIEKSGDKLTHTAFIGKAKTGLPDVVVFVNMEDRGGLAVDHLKQLAESAAADAGADAIIFDVVLVRDDVPGFAQEQHSGIAQGGYSAGKETNSLGCKRMGPREVLMNLSEEGL
jgi:hypothetical protein